MDKKINSQNQENLKEQIIRALHLGPEPSERQILLEKLNKLEQSKETD